MRIVLLAALLISSSARSEPLADFKALLSRVKQGEPGAVVVKPAAQKAKGIWIRTERIVTDIKHDVQKTETVYSPFRAWALLRIDARSDNYSTEDEARKAKRSLKNQGLVSLYRIDYAYREGRWVAVKGECDLELTVQNRGKNPGTPPPRPLDLKTGVCMGESETAKLILPIL